MARSLTGVVTSDKADKTIIVAVSTKKTHPVYKKQFSWTKKVATHDEDNQAHQGDKVQITETRPKSSRKHYVLTRIVERAPVRHVEAEDETIKEVSGQKTEEEKK